MLLLLLLFFLLSLLLLLRLLRISLHAIYKGLSFTRRKGEANPNSRDRMTVSRLFLLLFLLFVDIAIVVVIAIVVIAILVVCGYNCFCDQKQTTNSHGNCSDQQQTTTMMR